MEELNFRKIKCNQGHWSGVFPMGEPMPPACPVCGQPYDRRRNRPTACREDGSVPGEEQTAEEIPAGAQRRREEPSVKENQDNGMAAGESEVRNAMPENRRRRTAVFRETEQADAPVRRRSRQQETASSQSASPHRSFYVRAGDERVEIAAEGEGIGRSGTFSRLCMLNPLISRKHAWIAPDGRRGTVTISDQDSLNGTSVDDGQGRRRLGKDETAVLRPGDRFWLADQLFFVEE